MPRSLVGFREKSRELLSGSREADLLKSSCKAKVEVKAGPWRCLVVVLWWFAVLLLRNLSISFKLP